MIDVAVGLVVVFWFNRIDHEVPGEPGRILLFSPNTFRLNRAHCDHCDH